MKHATLDECFEEEIGKRTFKRKGSSIPDYVTGLEFLGYDSSGVTIDPKGVLRLRETSTRWSDKSSSIEYITITPFYKDVLLDRIAKSRVYKVRRTVLDAEVLLLAEQIRDQGNFIYYINYDFLNEKGNKLKRFNMLGDVQQQVDNSLEDPRTFREYIGRLVGNPVIDGTEFIVDMAWVQHQIGEGKLPYFLKGTEYVVSDGKKQVLANRYFNDPRVVVDCSFEGDYRRPTKTSGEFEFEEKRRLMKLFRQLVPEINEVTFPDNTRIKTD